jgi:hypothetical protein
MLLAIGDIGSREDDPASISGPLYLVEIYRHEAMAMQFSVEAHEVVFRANL